jgi:hypothetical protein
MALGLSLRVRQARNNVVETTIGASPTLRIRSGAMPANTAAARTGTVLATIALPADWLTNADASAIKSLSGTWSDNSADAAGTMGYFDIEGTGAVIDMQGTVTATGGGGDMEVDNTVVAAGQAFSVTAFSLSEPNA